MAELKELFSQMKDGLHYTQQDQELESQKGQQMEPTNQHHQEVNLNESCTGTQLWRSIVEESDQANMQITERKV